MNGKHYRSRKKELVQEYLKTIPGEHVSAADLCAAFARSGIEIGQATVYRQLERLVEEGAVRKYIVDANHPACFEYAGAPCRTRQCFHLKCEQCGKLIHLQCEELSMIQNHLSSEHQFRLDLSRTVFYGLCGDCQKEVQDQEEAGEEQ